MKRKRKGNEGPPERRIKFSEDLIWGIHPVLEIIRTEPERITELILQKDRHGSGWQELVDNARAAQVKCSFVERLKVTGNQGQPVIHQGVVARSAPVALFPFDELVEDFERAVKEGRKPRVMVCDSLQDPHNLGAIIRSAHASGVEYVLLTRERSAPLGGTAAKAAAGAVSRVKISMVVNLADALQTLQAAGAWIFGAVKESGAQSIYATDFNLPVCLVVGNEARGIRPLVRRQCDVLVSIPMPGEIDSLNSSVAAAVILFEIYRQRSVSAGTPRED